MAAQETRSVRARRMIAEVEESLRTKTPAQVSADFADWQKEFPKIFEMVLTRTYSREIMSMMLDQLERVERGSTSQHNASVAVGTVLVDKIVKPQLETK
jgi:IS4 transposase